MGLDPQGSQCWPLVIWTLPHLPPVKAVTFVNNDGQAAVRGQPHTLDVVASGQGQGVGLVAGRCSCRRAGGGGRPASTSSPHPCTKHIKTLQMGFEHVSSASRASYQEDLQIYSQETRNDRAAQ